MINIIGYGYVGSSIGFLCKNARLPFCIVDTVNKQGSGEEKYFDNVKDAVNYSEHSATNFYYICVPTPSKEDGSCNTLLVEEICKSINEIVTNSATESATDTVIIIKSTIVPGTSRKISNQCNNVSIFFIPEFLTERNALNDVLNENKVIIGGEKNLLVLDLITKLYGSSIEHRIYFCDYEYAEMTKYTINVYLAQKVSFFNGIHEVCEKLNINYDTLRQLFLLDNRIGESHTQVPGPDGKYGFGGTCFIKEMKGMIKLRESLNIEAPILKDIILDNEKRRNTL